MMLPAHKPKSASSTGATHLPQQRLPAPISESSNKSNAELIAACLDKAGRVFGYPPGWDKISAGIWLDALDNIPPALVLEAVDRYIAAPSDKPRWFPQPGQLRALISDELRWLRHNEIPALEHQPSAPMTDEDRSYIAAALRKRAVDLRSRTAADNRHKLAAAYVTDSADAQPNLWSVAWRKKIGIS
jgi:hypothetical protein